ncbi:hypothetical protein H7849_23290 [Alloacidobacterium dinghuense]|uniref:MacB-like periplasmic core domain-containing protein n=1 Tax=Alloacidobacterium dinghuense TaxID=2763107 RepID=A0A7G8BH97_9BACT|nr:hypothetical protein [Alloacidobacterium dinghuense]QNI31917.1 hypothetical protein H7849_23290 [Alloacidobacterium dinghuense]
MRPLPLHACMAVLRFASWIVPSEDRREWLREWKAELWHVAQLRAAEEATAFAGGAFRDAYLLRADLRRAGSRSSHAVRSSPVLCLLSLLMTALVSLGLAYVLPGTRGTLLPSPYRDARTLVVVARNGSSHTPSASISLGEFRYWQRATQGVFSDLAFYQIVRRQLHTGHGAELELSVARSSGNLLSLLETASFPVADHLATAGPQLVLSDALWRRAFHADPHILGRVVFLMGEKAMIIGVAKRDAWRLPGRVDAWLLEDQSRVETLAAQSLGFVVARIQPALVRSATEESWHMVVPQNDGSVAGFACVSVKHYAREPFVFFAFAALLALLALPATTSLPLGEYPYNPRQQSLALRLRRWLFFTAKLILIVPAICFASLDLAQAFQDTQSAQLILTFASALAGFRWMLRDQRCRCPVCLQLLRNPVHVGQASQNFLGWNGTELICVVGHGFLHVPELPTSWFSTQRWLYLDASWKSIFHPQEMARST